MPLYKRFDPPAFLPDFNSVPGLVDEWNAAVSEWFEDSIDAEKETFRKKGVEATVQYFNPVKEKPDGPMVEQAITWNAFPKELLRAYGRERAMVEADYLWPLSHYGPRFSGRIFDSTLYRPHNEYCEWHVFRDERTGNIRKLAFTSEPPEFYRALFGDEVEGYQFHGDRSRVLDLYREFVSEQVQLKDLIASEDLVSATGVVIVKRGEYDPYNKWNTTHGIMHLAAPPNTLTAEIRLGADATVLRRNGRDRLLVESDALICCAGYGGPDRNSDPTIGGAVNALARLGAMVTLRNPVGLYMDHIDLAGWSAPDGGSIAELVKFVRGRPDMIERLEVEAPAERGFTLSDVKIGGVPITHGGQVAECITVKLIGVALLSNVKPVPVSCDAQCCIDPAYPTSLDRGVAIGKPPVPGTVFAFVNEGEGAQLEPLKAVRALEEVVALEEVGVPRMIRRRRI